MLSRGALLMQLYNYTGFRVNNLHGPEVIMVKLSREIFGDSYRCFTSLRSFTILARMSADSAKSDKSRIPEEANTTSVVVTRFSER